jgi:hypothetical protein
MASSRYGKSEALCVPLAERNVDKMRIEKHKTERNADVNVEAFRLMPLVEFKDPQACHA